MALRDTWHRALVYFGLAEEDDGYYEEEVEPEVELEDRYRDRTPNVRRLSSRRCCRSSRSSSSPTTWRI